MIETNQQNWLWSREERRELLRLQLLVETSGSNVGKIQGKEEKQELTAHSGKER